MTENQILCLAPTGFYLFLCIGDALRKANALGYRVIIPDDFRGHVVCDAAGSPLHYASQHFAQTVAQSLTAPPRHGDRPSPFFCRHNSKGIAVVAGSAILEFSQAGKLERQNVE